jgi:hypothetical protein
MKCQWPSRGALCCLYLVTTVASERYVLCGFEIYESSLLPSMSIRN